MFFKKVNILVGTAAGFLVLAVIFAFIGNGNPIEGLLFIQFLTFPTRSRQEAIIVLVEAYGILFLIFLVVYFLSIWLKETFQRKLIVKLRGKSQYNISKMDKNSTD